MVSEISTQKSEEELLIEKFEEDPVYFVEVFIERTCSPKQQFFLEATKTHNHIVNAWSRQTGKSTIMASYIIWRLLYGTGQEVNNEHLNEQIAIVAPIKEQHKLLYDKMKTIIDKNEFIASFIIKINTETIIMKNGNFAKFMSASPGSKIRGFTATCIVIDETQDITDSKYSADILPFGATTNALIIESGTPKTKNHFYKALASKRTLTIKQPWFECPFLSKDYVMGQKEISPDGLWRQEYLCEFVEEGVLAFPSVLFEPEMTDAGKETGRWNLAEYSIIDEINQLNKEKVDAVVKENEATYVAGLDLGKQNDNTELVIYRDDIRPIRLCVHLKFPLKTPYSEIARVIGMFYKVYSPYEFNIDYTNEKSFIEMLHNEDVPIIIDKNMKRGAIQFSNKNKTEMINNTRILLEQFQLQLPKESEELISQFLNQQFEVNEQGKYKFFHPSNEHDDGLWATLLALKNITLFTAEDVINFQNPWDKHDEKIHGVNRKKAKEVVYSTKKLRERNRYTFAEQRRQLRG